MQSRGNCKSLLFGIVLLTYPSSHDLADDLEQHSLSSSNKENTGCPADGGPCQEDLDKHQYTQSFKYSTESKIQSLETTIENLKVELQHLKNVISRKETNSEEIDFDYDRNQKLPAYQRVPFLNYQNRKRILITGGAGFLGSHLTDRLMLQGHEVVVADNFFTGRKRSIEHWVNHPNFELHNHDMINPLHLEVDEIYHLASPASPPHYMFNPVKTIKTNTQGTINMLGLAKRVKAKILIASTSEVYGDPEVHPQDETYWGHVNPIGPRACYDEGKRVAETLAYAYEKQEAVQVRVARIFNTYGPRMHMNDGRVVSNFILQALKGEHV